MSTVVGEDEEMKGGGDEVGKGSTSEESGEADWVTTKAKRQKVMKKKEKKKARKARLKAMAVKGQGKVRVVEDGSGEDSVGSDEIRMTSEEWLGDHQCLADEWMELQLMKSRGIGVPLESLLASPAFRHHRHQRDNSSSRRRTTSLHSPFLSSPLPQ